MSPIFSLSKPKKIGLAASLAIAVVTALNGAAAKAAVIFSDDFSTSGLDAAPTGATGTSTTYQLVSSKSRSPAPSIAAGHLKFGIASTTSGVIEAQARVPSITLATAGDSLEYTVVFTNTAGLLTANGTLGFGLYNSSSIDAITGGLNGTAVSANTAHTTDGTIGWQGYVSSLAFTGNNSRFQDRKVQNNTTSTAISDNDQDIVATGSASSTYNNPVAALVGSNSPSNLTLTAATQYTEDMLVTLNGDGSLTLSSNLYSGNAVAGTPLSTFSATTGTTPLTTTFDAIGLGWRATGSVATAIDVNSITINANAGGAAPEPASIGALAIGALALATRRRKA